MRFGVGGVCTEETLRPSDVARRVEDLGLESLFLGEHTHIPWSRESAYPMGELPRNYWRTLDPFVALTDAAAGSSRIRLGTGICQLAQRDPIVCAKEVASVDVLSDGVNLQVTAPGDLALPEDGEVLLLFAPERTVALPGKVS